MEKSIKIPFSRRLRRKGGRKLKEEEKKPPVWEVTDPKPPVIRSGHMEGKRQH